LELVAVRRSKKDAGAPRGAPALIHVDQTDGLLLSAATTAAALTGLVAAAATALTGLVAATTTATGLAAAAAARVASHFMAS
jgi:hypothetical protein